MRGLALKDLRISYVYEGTHPFAIDGGVGHGRSGGAMTRRAGVWVIVRTLLFKGMPMVFAFIACKGRIPAPIHSFKS